MSTHPTYDEFDEPIPYELGVCDEPIPYQLTEQGWQATSATITPAEAARFLGVTHDHVCGLARRGVLSGVRVPATDGRHSRWGWVWVLDRGSVLEYPRIREEREAALQASAAARQAAAAGTRRQAPRRTLPAGPLLQVVTARGGPARAGFRYRSAEEKAFARARRDGVLTPRQADQLATLLGVHPGELWGDDWYSSR